VVGRYPIDTVIETGALASMPDLAAALVEAFRGGSNAFPPNPQ
jgi:hypothetical protein